MREIVPENGMVITEDTKLVPGVYTLPDGIIVGANHIIIDGKGVTFVSGQQQGSAVRVQGRNSITLRGISIQGYYHGIRVDDSEEIVIEDCTIRNTAEIEGIATFLYLWKPIEESYAGAMLLHNVRGGRIANCDVQHQMNGILLYGCKELRVENNNASFNSGWGLYLSASERCDVVDNRMDFCNRVYRHTDGQTRVEADAAGIVLVNGSSHNRILRNSCLCGGDGIFLCGYEHPGKLNPCNENLFEENDCRLSPNNAIEATFSSRNIFRRNDCSRSNYGFWMGYSTDCVLEENRVEFNRWVGIAIEHGYGFAIRNNQILRNGEGIRLWTRGGGGPVVAYYPDRTVSHQFVIERNKIEGNRIGFHGYTGDDTPDESCYDFHVRHNQFLENQVGVRFGRVHQSSVYGNTFGRHYEKNLDLEANSVVGVSNNEFLDEASDQSSG